MNAQTISRVDFLSEPGAGQIRRSRCDIAHQTNILSGGSTQEKDETNIDHCMNSCNKVLVLLYDNNSRWFASVDPRHFYGNNGFIQLFTPVRRASKVEVVGLCNAEAEERYEPTGPFWVNLMINLEARSVENINTGSTSLDHCGIAKPLEEERKSNRDDCNTNAACCVLNQLPYKLYRRISGVIRSNDLKFTADAHRIVFLIIIESEELRHATRQTISPFVILRNTLAPGGLTRTCAYLCHDKVAHILTVGSPVERGARVHGETVLYPLEQDRKGMLVWKATWNADWHKLQWNVFDHEQIAIESAILVTKKVIPEGPSPCVYLEAIDRTLYRNASGRRTCTVERLLDDTDRMSRLVLLDLLYSHLHMVKDERIFRQCFRHIFEAHYRVYDATGVLHRDINIDNLMVRMGRDGSKQGVLIDWDLAGKVTDEQDHTGTRTGTRAFIAYELFSENASKHILRFDWESFLYYLMWVVFVMIDEDYRTTETKRIKDETNEKPDTLGSSMVRWPKLNDEELCQAKALAISTKGKYMYSRSVHKFHSTFSTWINPIWELFIRGDEARMKGDPTFDYETLGNRLTYTGLHDILDREPN